MMPPHLNRLLTDYATQLSGGQITRDQFVDSVLAALESPPTVTQPELAAAIHAAIDGATIPQGTMEDVLLGQVRIIGGEIMFKMGALRQLLPSPYSSATRTLLAAALRQLGGTRATQSVYSGSGWESASLWAITI